jgi:miniconductance mechanosensitive channel
MDFLTAYPWIITIGAVAALLLAAIAVNFIVKILLVKGLDRALRATPFGKDDELISNGVIRRLSNIVPAIVLAWGIQLVPHLSETIVAIVRNVCNAFIVLAVAMAVSAALNVVGTLYNRRPEARLKPIKGYLQVLKIVVYAITAILNRDHHRPLTADPALRARRDGGRPHAGLSGHTAVAGRQRAAFVERHGPRR